MRTAILSSLAMALTGCVTDALHDKYWDWDQDGVEVPDDCDDDDKDAAVEVLCYPDLDGDGDGDAAASGALACTCAEGTESAEHSDCDDSDPGSAPGAVEVCDDGLDQDCDGEADEDCMDTHDPAMLFGVSGSLAGYAVVGLGDLAGTGTSAFAIGAPGNTPGTVFAVWDVGRDDGNLYLSTSADVTRYLCCEAEGDPDVGLSIGLASADDGTDTLVMGAPNPQGLGLSDPGGLYLYAHPSAGDGDVSLSTDGVRIDGETGDPAFGIAVEGTAHDQIIVGSRYSDDVDHDAWLITGVSAITANTTVETLAGSGQATLLDESNGGMSISALASGDAGGVPFFAIGAFQASGEDISDEGTIYLVQTADALDGGGTYDLNHATHIFGGEDGALAGASVAVGDVDGDGHMDLLVGGAATPQAWLVLNIDARLDGDYGTRERLSGTGAIADLHLTVEHGDEDWVQVALPGPVGGAGESDLLVSAHGGYDLYYPGAGAAFLYRLSGSPSGTVILDDAGTNADVLLLSEDDQSQSGSAIAGPGDLDGDGYNEILVGATRSDEAGDRAGAVTLFFGGLF